jgi:hypothetical protein
MALLLELLLRRAFRKAKFSNVPLRRRRFLCLMDEGARPVLVMPVPGGTESRLTAR